MLIVLFSDVFTFLKRSIKSNRAVVAIFSAITGCMPIKGRVTVSAGLLDTLATKKTLKKSKLRAEINHEKLDCPGKPK